MIGKKDEKIKVLIIDDSVVFQRLLTMAIERDPDLEVIGTAANPYRAVEIIEKVIPDVITLDIQMPIMDGITFLEKLMRQYPLPVIIISSVTRGNREICLKAYQEGALEVLNKPSMFNSDEKIAEFKEFICEKIKGAATANIQMKSRVSHGRRKSLTKVVQAGRIDTKKVIAIGASAGGTQAIERVLVDLPAHMPPILIVQHMPKDFTKLFANRLNSLTKIEVKEAEDGEPVNPGTAYVAPGDQHMIIMGSNGNYRISLNQYDPVNRHRPSVDVMFNSVAERVGKDSIGIILTGMGADGANGLLSMKTAGAHTIAQDEQSSVVYGMPAQAMKLNAAVKELALFKIPEYLTKYLSLG